MPKENLIDEAGMIAAKQYWDEFDDLVNRILDGQALIDSGRIAILMSMSLSLLRALKAANANLVEQVFERVNL